MIRKVRPVDVSSSPIPPAHKNEVREARDAAVRTEPLGRTGRLSGSRDQSGSSVALPEVSHSELVDDVELVGIDTGVSTDDAPPRSSSHPDRNNQNTDDERMKLALREDIVWAAALLFIVVAFVVAVCLIFDEFF